PQNLYSNIYYGIRLKTPQGEQWVPNTFSRIMDIMDLNESSHKKLMDIATMPVTEILKIE
ncbi:MAG: hypothetical protein SV062_10515, partial [Thermodesulfobacteriota bacterium]|nr:hypothetical protein [Thermodesulfobacteriota bacterium]